MFTDEKVLYQKLGSVIRERRLALGMTQEELATASGVRRTSVTNIESGRQKPPLHVLYDICIALSIEVASVLPSNITVQRSPSTTFSINTKDVQVPPKTAEFLKQLLEE